MAPKTLTLEIVTPEGSEFRESDIDGIVVRRKERRPYGSEIEVLPMHGPMLARVAKCTLRFYRDGATHHVDIDGGFMEVKYGHVTVVVSGAHDFSD